MGMRRASSLVVGKKDVRQLQGWGPMVASCLALMDKLLDAPCPNQSYMYGVMCGQVDAIRSYQILSRLWQRMCCSSLNMFTDHCNLHRFLAYGKDIE